MSLVGVDPVFAQRMVTLGEAFSQRLSPAQISLFYRALSDVDLPTLDIAIARCIERETFFPRVATIRGYVDTSHTDRAVLTWSTLERAAESIGGWAKVEIRDSYAASAILHVFGSWPAFCRDYNQSGFQTWAAKRVAYLAAYRQASLHEGVGAPVIMEGLCAAAGEDGTKPIGVLKPAPDRAALRAVSLGELPG